MRGVVLADGHGVQKDVAGGLASGSKTARTYKQIKSLQKHFLPFDALLCPNVGAGARAARQITDHLWSTGQAGSFLLFLLSGGTVEYSHIPDPSEVADRLGKSISQVRRQNGMEDRAVPTVRKGVPREISTRLRDEAKSSRQPDYGKDLGGPRWRMIFRASFDPNEE